MSSIPVLPGAYAVQFTLVLSHTITIGSLGKVHLPQGEYIYLGSARGPGGLRARLARHLDQQPAKRHWHIDYLHATNRACAFCYVTDQEIEIHPILNPIECIWSQALNAHPRSFIPVPGFGAGDCLSVCSAHLIAFPPTTSQPLPILTSAPIQSILANSIAVPQEALIFGLLA